MAIEYNSSIVTDGLMFCVDAANPKSYSRNCHPMPTNLYDWTSVYGAYHADVYRDSSVVSPVGNTPLKLVNNGNDSYIQTYNAPRWNLAPATAGQTWTVSVYAKASVATTGQIFIFGANSSGAYIPAAGTALTINITTEWQRFSATWTLADAATAYIQTRLDGPDVYTSPVSIWFDGLQVERSASMTEFNRIVNLNNTTVNDLIGVNPLTIYGVNCAFNTAGYVTFPNDTIVDYLMNSFFPFPTDDHTVECWFKSNFSQPNQSIYTYSVAGDNQYLLYTNSNTNIVPYSFTNALYSVTVPDMTNVWCNFTRTRINLTGEEKYYFNGVLVGSQISNGATATPTNGYLIIGQDADSPGGGFSTAQNLDGSFSKLSIYNKALTADEVKQNFNALRGRYGL